MNYILVRRDQRHRKWRRHYHKVLRGNCGGRYMIDGARDTVNIDESVHEIYRLLTEGNDPVNAPFKTMKDLFLWAACLGCKKNSRKRLEQKKITIFI